MFRTISLGAAILLAGCTTAPAPDSQHARTDLVAACGERQGWNDPAPPAHVLGNVWYVGTCGISVLPVTSPAGHVLLDGATDKAVPSILANVRAAGFDPGGIHWIVNSHEHNDHVGGLAGLQAATGARVAAGAAAAKALEAGQVSPEDPQAPIHTAFAPVKVDRVLRDGETLQMGELVLTMHENPVHALGSTSWTWQSAAPGGAQVTVTFADSTSTISADGYRFMDHPERRAAIVAGLGKVAALLCGVMLTPHTGQSDMFERLAGRAELIDATACRAYADQARARFGERLIKEQSGQ